MLFDKTTFYNFEDNNEEDILKKNEEYFSKKSDEIKKLENNNKTDTNGNIIPDYDVSDFSFGSSDVFDLNKIKTEDRISYDDSIGKTVPGIKDDGSTDIDPSSTNPTLLESDEKQKYSAQVLSIQDVTLHEGGQSDTDKTAESIYTGLDYNNEDIDIDVLAWSKNTQLLKEQDRFLKNLVAPWDRRFKSSYTSSQSIGNSMPYGAEWVGSQSIMNTHALIRFEHIASSKHHHLLMDQMGQNAFRSPGLYFPPVKMSDLNLNTMKTADGNEVISVIDGEEYAVVDSSTSNDIKTKYNIKGEIYTDDDGGMFSYDEDPFTELWEPANPDKLPKEEGGQPLTELEIMVDPNSFGKEPMPGALGKSGTVLDELITQFWAERKGLVKCDAPDTGGMKYSGMTTPGACEAIKKNDQKAIQDELESFKKDMAKVEEYVNAHKAAGWKYKENKRQKKYIRSEETMPMMQGDLEPTYENLVNEDNFKGNEQFLYSWSDFLYLKHYNKIPNNRLVTLRRFPVPVLDHAKVPSQDDEGKFIMPIASVSTYFDDSTGNKLEGLLGMAFKMKWKPLEASVNELQGNEKGVDDALGSDGFAGKLAKTLMGGAMLTGSADFGSISGYDEQRAKFDPYKDGPYANQPYGPVNRIDKTMVRDAGLEYEQSITLKFVYSLRSIGGINPKAAMLDILSNFLAVTYNNAPFWGGAIKYFPNKPAYPFPGGKKGMDQWYNGDIGGFMDSIGQQMTAALGNLGDMLAGLFSDPMGTIKKLAVGGAKLAMAKKQKGNRPQILGFKALLTGEPVGEWHLMIGNPFNPIAMIGNLIVTNATIAFNEELGTDDFPTELILSVTLQHGRPRDKGDIESIFNRGSGRLHYSRFNEKIEPWNNASSTKMTKDAQKGAGMGDVNINTGVASGNEGSKHLSKTTGGQGSVRQVNSSGVVKKKRLIGERTSGGFKRDLLVSQKEADGVFNSAYRNIYGVGNAAWTQAKRISEKVGVKQSGEK